MDRTVQKWEIRALEEGYPMNRRVRRAWNKQTATWLNKLRRYAIRGSKRAMETLIEWEELTMPPEEQPEE